MGLVKREAAKVVWLQEINRTAHRAFNEGKNNNVKNNKGRYTKPSRCVIEIFVIDNGGILIGSYTSVLKIWNTYLGIPAKGEQLQKNFHLSGLWV